MSRSGDGTKRTSKKNAKAIQKAEAQRKHTMLSLLQTNRL